ncbi:MAG: protein kinase [Desulfurococcaceae archaeon]
MFLYVCRGIDKASVYISDPLVLSSLLLVKNRKFLLSISGRYKEIVGHIMNAIKDTSKDCLIHLRFSVADNIYRVFALGNVAVAAIRESGVGEVVKYGAEALEELSSSLSTDMAVWVFLEEIPIAGLDPGLVSVVSACAEEVDKPHIALWKRKGLYWFTIEELISDKGNYTYVFRARDARGNVYALKVLKEDTITTKSYVDAFKGCLHGLMISTLSEREFYEFVELKGYDRDALRDLYVYRNYVVPVRATLIPRNALDTDTYLAYPPVIVEDLASLGDLETFIQRNGARGLEEALYIATRISGALALAHLVNIAHLDVKPRNILLYRDEHAAYKYVPKLGDFSGALGDPARGYKLTKLTPAYADPVALAKGVADFKYDVYSVAMVVAFMLASSIPKHRLILNLILLRVVHEYPIPMEDIKDDEKSLKEFEVKALDAAMQLKNRALSLQDFIYVVERDLERLDDDYMPWLNDIPRPIAKVLRKALVLKSEERYGSCVEMWLDLRKALIEEKLESLLPR